MPLDIDEIRRGRRRDWEKLKDPGERKVPGQPVAGDTESKPKEQSLLRRKEQARASRTELDRAEWGRTKRQLVRWGIVAGSVLFLYWGAKAAMHFGRIHSRNERIAELQQLVDAGERIQTLKTPLDAWASWRAAWLQRDAGALYRISSPRRQEHIRAKQSQEAAIEQLQRQFDKGIKDPERVIAAEFRDPEIVRMGSAPWDNQELAVFRSKPIAPAGPGNPAYPWIAAFSWDRASREWRLEDVRQDEQWRERWATVAHIKPVRAINRNTTADY